MAAAILMRRLFADDARRNDIESPQMARACLGDINCFLVRREADAIRHDHWLDKFADQTAIGPGVVEAPEVHLARAPLAMVGEVETAVTVEDNVVRALKRIPVAG